MDKVPGVILPGQAAAPMAQPVAADPLAAANPAVVAAGASAASLVAQGAKKKKMLIISGVIAGVVVLAGVLCFVWPGFLKNGDKGAGGGSPNKGSSDNTFAAMVAPIFKNSTCYDCHDGSGGEKVKGKFDLTNGDSVMNVIEPGKPDQSELIIRLLDKDDPMPQEGKGEMLNAADVDKVKAWITAGGKF
jgi:mono/diheme cytochrome c family protein